MRRSKNIYITVCLFFSSLLYSKVGKADAMIYSTELKPFFSIFMNRGGVQDPQSPYLPPLQQVEYVVNKPFAPTLNLRFRCPQHSFIYGLASDFTPSAGERAFRFSCAYLENDKQMSLKKKNCKMQKMHPEKGTQFSSMCPENTFVDGFDFVFDSTSKTHKMQAYCCELNDWYGDSFSEDSCQTIDLNSSKENFNKVCNSHHIFSGVSGEIKDGDYLYKAKCCHAKIFPEKEKDEKK